MFSQVEATDQPAYLAKGKKSFLRTRLPSFNAYAGRSEQLAGLLGWPGLRAAAMERPLSPRLRAANAAPPPLALRWTPPHFAVSEPAKA